MTRSAQIRIPGTERPDHPDIEEAALAYIDVRDQRAALSKKEAQKKLEMGAVMKAADVKRYKFFDEHAGRYRVARIVDGEEKFIVEETYESLPEVGAGVPAGNPDDHGIPQGLIDQALRDDDTNVEVTSDGEVVVPEKAVPRKPRAKAKKKS
jgi:hypothetical protein